MKMRQHTRSALLMFAAAVLLIAAAIVWVVR